MKPKILIYDWKGGVYYKILFRKLDLEIEMEDYDNYKRNLDKFSLVVVHSSPDIDIIKNSVKQNVPVIMESGDDDLRKAYEKNLKIDDISEELAHYAKGRDDLVSKVKEILFEK